MKELNVTKMIDKLQEIFTSNKHATKCDIEILKTCETAVSFKIVCTYFTFCIQGAQLTELMNEFGDPDPMIIPDQIHTLKIVMDVSNEEYYL